MSPLAARPPRIDLAAVFKDEEVRYDIQTNPPEPPGTHRVRDGGARRDGGGGHRCEFVLLRKLGTRNRDGSRVPGSSRPADRGVCTLRHPAARRRLPSSGRRRARARLVAVDAASFPRPDRTGACDRRRVLRTNPAHWRSLPAGGASQASARRAGRTAHARMVETKLPPGADCGGSPRGGRPRPGAATAWIAGPLRRRVTGREDDCGQRRHARVGATGAGLEPATA